MDKNPPLFSSLYHGSEITLRDLFAGLALAGLLADCGESNEAGVIEGTALQAYWYADAMLKARESKMTNATDEEAPHVEGE